MGVYVGTSINNYFIAPPPFMDITEDEGFYVDKPVLESVTVCRDTSRLTRPVDFEPRYVCAMGLLRREPHEASFPFDQCEVLYSSLGNSNTSPVREQLDCPRKTLQEQYSQKDIYQHVYMRKHFSEQTHQDLSQNSFQLSHLSEYSFDDYAILKPYTFPAHEPTPYLSFDSRFQGGNLNHAFYHRQSREYHLMMQNDTNTLGYNQWFYFGVKGMVKGANYTFNVVNYRKRSSLFEEGMLPAIYSFSRRAWFRAGRNVSYRKSQFVINEDTEDRFYRLSFNLVGEDMLLVAAGLPYSYTRLMRSLKTLHQNNKANQHLQLDVNIAGYTIGNNSVPVVTIQARGGSANKTIVITARQHSGETWSSYLCQEVIHQLISNQKIKELLHKFVFKIFPMINVDGVIYGNFRCDMGGVDLNRKWQEPCKFLQPHIFSMKEYLTDLNKMTPIEYYFDLHGHSKKLNSFCYCCLLNEQSRVLPLMLSRLTPIINFKDCTFGLGPDKIRTARGFMFQLCQEVNVLTIECSFFGTNFSNKNVHFEPHHMSQLAKALMMGVWVNTSDATYDGINCKSIKSEVASREGELRQFGDLEESGSDSDPEKQQMNEEERDLIIPQKTMSIIRQSKSLLPIKGKKTKKKVKKEKRVLEKTEKVDKLEKVERIERSRSNLLKDTGEERKSIIDIDKNRLNIVKDLQKAKPLFQQLQTLGYGKIRTPARPLISSKTPVPTLNPISSVVETLTLKSCLARRAEVLSINTHNVEPKLSPKYSPKRRNTLMSQPEYTDELPAETKSFIIRKEHKVSKVRVMNEKLLRIEAKERGLCLVSESRELQHIFKRETGPRRESCMSNPYNQYHPVKRRESVVTFDSYKKKEKKPSLLNEVSKLWKFHVQKYTKELE